jgi:hypothetical protein
MYSPSVKDVLVKILKRQIAASVISPFTPPRIHEEQCGKAKIESENADGVGPDYLVLAARKRDYPRLGVEPLVCDVQSDTNGACMPEHD